MESLKKAGFAEPSEIQEKAIPLILKGKDIIGNSATGSGKTLAFGSGIIEKAEKKRGIQALILTPTRELAEQVGEVLKKFSKPNKLDVSIVYGGVSISQQISELRRAEIVVGTPGRLLDHLGRGTINLSNLKILVLDEADRMLDMGFLNDVEKIIKNCPEKRQTLLFSATISMEIEHLAEKYLTNPERISVESYVDPSKLKQVFYDVPRMNKFSLLVHLLKRESKGLIMVFCNTRNNTDFVADNLRNLKIDALAIHGGLTQGKRTRIMQKFHEKSVYVLVCTDIAARGLDIKGVSHVYNYDLPKTSSDYIHRIGRTARAGKEGIAINLL
ncbi:ATP-dependent helicase, partial [Candidatus Pacearchaeota archaeon CG10_big_fil_rev_8_21_14_0_10_34_12]